MDWAAIERTTLLVDAGSGLVFLALGLWVLALKPRRPVALALGGYAAALGLNAFIHNLGNGRLDWLAPPWEAIEVVAMLAVGAALTALAVLFPRPLAAGERAQGLTVASAVAAVQLIGVPLAVAASPSVFAAALGSAYILAYAATWFALALFAVRYGRSDTPEEARALAVVSVALGLEMGMRTGIAIIATPRISLEPMSILTGAASLAAAAVTVLWLRNTTRGSAEARRRARNVALFFPALLITGVAFAAATDPERAINLGPMGLSRIAGVLLLAWAILRGFVPGVDARVRWTLSKSTVAAAFIAVFFVVSEGAQILFGRGDEWMGLAAAGALVFAISPLQRAADRFAEKAVPVAAASPGGARGESSYRNAVRFALKGRTLTRTEETHLHELARDLGLDGARAHSIIAEIEREVAE